MAGGDDDEMFGGIEFSDFTLGGHADIVTEEFEGFVDEFLVFAVGMILNGCSF